MPGQANSRAGFRVFTNKVKDLAQLAEVTSQMKTLNK
ncbi:MAG: hypothetical protein RL748_3460 [Pseudomonadota bacterium]